MAIELLRMRRCVDLLMKVRRKLLKLEAGGAFGAVLPDKEWERRAELLKEWSEDMEWELFDLRERGLPNDSPPEVT